MGEHMSDIDARQRIVDAVAGLSLYDTEAYRAAEAEFRAKVDELQRQCAELGHIWGKPSTVAGVRNTRVCVCCRAWAEPQLPCASANESPRGLASEVLGPDDLNRASAAPSTGAETGPA